jgi:hypothetical protein
MRILSLVMLMMVAVAATAGVARADPDGAIVGIVVLRPAGAPIGGVTVTLRGGALDPPRTAVTDDHGWYHFFGVPAGPGYEVEVVHGAEPTVRGDVVVAAGQVTTIDVRVRGPDATGVAGVVRDAATTDPLAGATVMLTGDGTTQTTISDGHGGYRFDDMPPGTYTVTVYYDSQVVERTGIAIGAGETASVDLAVSNERSFGEVVSMSAASYVVGSVRSYASSWLIGPTGWQTTGELRFLTADAAAGGAPTRMTDVVVARAGVRRSIRGRLELAAAVDVLPKQPSGTDELVWQSAELSARHRLGRKHAAYVAAAGGPLTDELGTWVGAGAGVQRRSIVHDTLSFQLTLGGGVTPLLLDGSTAWLGEVVARGQTLFRAEEAFGLWLGADFAFPVAHGGDVMGVALDPQPRVDVSAGVVYSMVDRWDVSLQLSIVDRGEVDVPGTTLPILQGGRDQTILSFGLTRHFGGVEDSARYLAYGF